MIKTVITAAGKGTRLLPITKEIPKELMPIFAEISNNNKVVMPLLQFIYEQLYSINIRNYCFVVGNNRRSIKEHFTPNQTFLNDLTEQQQKLIKIFYKKLEKSDFFWVNQIKPIGFGDAVKRSENFIKKDNFIVHAGDVAIIGRDEHPITRMINAYKKFPETSAILLIKKVKDSKRYGVPKIKKIGPIFEVKEVEEKPEKPKSNMGLLPIYFFKPIIFDSLKKIKRGKGNEFQLTDAIQNLIERGEKVIAVPLKNDEIELDVGTVNTYRYSLEKSYIKAKIL